MRRAVAALVFFAALGALSGRALSADGRDGGVITQSSMAIEGQSAWAKETALGNLAADAVRAQTEADAAILPGGLFLGDLPAGQITWQSGALIFTENPELAVAEVPARTLYDMLEVGFSELRLTEEEVIDVNASAFEGYPQISGITLGLDMAMPPGERLMWIDWEDGTELLPDNEAVIRVAAPAAMFEGGCGYPKVSYESADLTLWEAFFDYLSQYETVIDPGTRRVSIAGTRFVLTEYLPVWVIILMAVFLAIGRGSRLHDASDPWLKDFRERQ